VKTDVRAIEAAPAADDAGTRDRVMALIMQRGATTAADIATVLEITPAAVRRHLTTLTQRGLVTTRERRTYGSRERGRPAKVYVPTDAGRADFTHAYDDLALGILDHLRDRLGDEAVADFARLRFAAAEQRYRAAMAAKPGLTALEALTEALVDDGFMAAVHPVRSGQQLCQHHCPVSAVAAKYPELCEAEAEVFGRLLGSHVQRLATIAHGDGVCTLHVPHPVHPDQHQPHHHDKESA
jgi:predicted ArsR family transcriptional regulator